MAAPYKPELFTLDSVINFYENANGVHYRVYGGTSPKPEYCRYSFEGNEKEMGLQELERALMGLQQNTDNTNPYLIQVFPKAKKTKEGQVVQIPTQIVFQLNKPERFVPQMMGGTDPELKMILAKMVETQNILISKMNANEVEEEVEEEKPQGLAGLLNNPDFQNVAIAGISAILGKFINGTPQAQALAGVPDEQEAKAKEAIRILSKKDSLFGDHLLYLANLPDTQFKMLLSFIK